MLGPLLAGQLASAAPLEISVERIAAHAAVLASDAFEGRQPGTAGEVRTLAYIASEYAAAGLKPAVDGRWFQPVPLVSRIPTEGRLALGDFAVSREAMVLLGAAGEDGLSAAPLLFVGHAMPAVIRGSRHVKGAVLLYLPGAPADVSASNMASVGMRQAVMRSAGAAAGLMVIADGDWDDAATALRKGTTTLADDPTLRFRGILRESAARQLIEAAGGDYDRLRSRAARSSMRPVRLDRPVAVSALTELRRFTSWNVAGLIEGTRPDETVLVLAHWDHLGICRPEGAADRICNGAVDNASGVGAMIEIARALAAGPRPERSLLFLATTAEEMGLLGARAYVAQPLRPLAGTIAAINLDMIALRPTGAPIAIVGRRLSTLDGIIAAVGAEQGRRVYEGKGPDAYVQRSDAYPFLNAGVPAVVATGVLASPPEDADPLLDAFFRDRYHQSADNIDAGIDWSGAAEDASLALRVIRRLAQGTTNVRWLADSPYQRPPADPGAR